MNKQNVILSGSLSFLSLADLLQLLGTNGSSGILRIVSRYASEPAEVILEKGNPVNASNGALSGLEALYSLFGWTEGEFEFIHEKVDTQKIISKSRMEIILDGLRMLDDGKIDKLGPVSFQKDKPDSSGKTTKVPVIKGPLIDYMYVVDEEEFQDKAKIIEEGKHGNWIWVILEGVVDIIKDTPQGPLTIAKIGSGGFIGSMGSFLIEGNIRSATVVASGKVQLGVLDSQRLSSEYACVSSAFKGLMQSLDNRLKQVTDRAVEFCLKKNTLKASMNDKTPIVKQGEKGDKLFTITRGNALVVRNTDTGYVPLVVLDEGDYFGYAPFVNMGHEPYGASVFGSKDLKVSPIDSEALQREYEQLPSTLKHILDNLAVCTSVTTKMACEFQKKIGPKPRKNS